MYKKALDIQPDYQHERFLHRVGVQLRFLSASLLSRVTAAAIGWNASLICTHTT